MSEVLKVKPRQPGGKRDARRLRRGGQVPVNLYGHGQQNVYLAAAADDLRTLLRHGARVIDLEGEQVQEKAFIRELQWDTYGLEVLHVDLTRVSADERVEVRVAVELRGAAPGVAEGGIVELLVHDLEIECLAIDIPEKLILRVNQLKLGDDLTAAAVELPPGAKLVSDPETMVAHCVKPKAEVEVGAEAAPVEGAEPEVIGRKAEEEGETEE